MTSTVVPVALPGTPYDIVIGSGVLREMPALLGRHCPAARYVIITDSTVGALYAAGLCTTLPGATVLEFTAGEAHKTRDTWSSLTDKLLAAGAGRDAAILALGGGVVGDVAGFVAATYLRGIPVVQVPTSLLAMIDSSVGGKTGVDTASGKNLIGAFHQPKLVVADVATLATLPKNHLAAGLAEAIKHGAIADRTYFDALVRDRASLMACDSDALVKAVVPSVRLKAGVVVEDERESGRRATLNFGHTIGHAIEAAMNYSLLHGEAISIGMVLEAKLGEAIGVTAKGEAAVLASTFESFGLHTRMPKGVDRASVLSAMRHDKKARAGEIRFSLIKRVGESARDSKGGWTIQVPFDRIEEVLATG